MDINSFQKRVTKKKKRKAPVMFHPSVEASFLRGEEFMKKSPTSLIYVYRLLNRQVVSGARGSAKQKYIKTMAKGLDQLS